MLTLCVSAATASVRGIGAWWSRFSSAVAEVSGAFPVTGTAGQAIAGLFGRRCGFRGPRRLLLAWLLGPAAPAFAFGVEAVRFPAPAEVGLPAPVFGGLVVMLGIFCLSVIVIAATKILEVIEERYTRNRRGRGRRRLAKWLDAHGGLE